MPKRYDVRRAWWYRLMVGGVALLGGMAALPVQAALGGPEATVEADRLQVAGTARVLRSPAYTVHELQTPSGTVVREFVSPAGTVFGVAWQGPTMPDLRQVLGAYFEPYAQAATQRRAHGPLTVAQPGLVVHSGGHMRAFVGRAYIPQAVPPGVDAAAIK
jgi:hypothetical protein